MENKQKGGLNMQKSDKLKKDYSVKVQQLFNLGAEALIDSYMPDYSQFDFTQDDIPDLLRLAVDNRYDEFYNGTEGEDDDIYIYDELYFASVHAVNLLGLLQSIESIPYILKRVENEADDSDYFFDSVKYYVKNIGAEGLEYFEKYIFDNAEKYKLYYIFDGLLDLALEDSSCRDWIVEIFVKYIKNEITDPEAISTAIYHLIDLTQDEYIELIREAFATKEIDELMCGSLEEIEIELGLREKPKSMIEEEEFEKMILQKIASSKITQITKPIIKDKKTGRNDPCPCGSGKKYKKCCMNKEA